MAILEQIKVDLQGAMRAGEKERVGALRMVLSELQKAAKEGGDDASSPEAELAVLRRERKRRLEAAAAYRDAGHQERAAQLEGIVTRAVSDSGAASVKDMGIAMKQAMAAVDGRADGKRVSGLVRAALQG
jgi:uncharacterized protein YqeY